MRRRKVVHVLNHGKGLEALEDFEDGDRVLIAREDGSFVSFGLGDEDGDNGGDGYATFSQ